MNIFAYEWRDRNQPVITESFYWKGLERAIWPGSRQGSRSLGNHRMQADRKTICEERQTCLPEAYKERKEEAGANGWQEAHNGAGGGEPLSVPGSKKQGLWGKERVACSKDVSLGHMLHALSCKEKRGKQPLLLSL